MTAGPHTEGALEVGGLTLRIGEVVVAEVEDFVRADRDNTEEVNANALRLAACWNACQHLTLEQVERLGRLLEQYNRDEVDILLTESGV